MAAEDAPRPCPLRPLACWHCAIVVLEHRRARRFDSLPKLTPAPASTGADASDDAEELLASSPDFPRRNASPSDSSSSTSVASRRPKPPQSLTFRCIRRPATREGQARTMARGMWSEPMNDLSDEQLDRLEPAHANFSRADGATRLGSLPALAADVPPAFRPIRKSRIETMKRYAPQGRDCRDSTRCRDHCMATEPTDERLRPGRRGHVPGQRVPVRHGFCHARLQ